MGSSAFRLGFVLSKFLNVHTTKVRFLSRSVTKIRAPLFTAVKTHNFYKVQESELRIDKNSSVLVAPSRSYSTDNPLSVEDITAKVLHVCKTFDKIPVDKVTLEAHFMNDLGLDSLDHVELIMNIEDDFNFEIPDGDAEKLLRPRDVVEYITRKQSST
ncbi:hypothetical protein JTE90_002675 [Oedothorax gibbosus]|uniref:Acyl carrier protein n=1 Tax=Oedothorax gibbosus TaxID=931172 RepID=A0AAV6TYF8_9ARAC|nr:hypothetical protein JTE90_002675 [Oedothorax gibbosus]